MLGLILMFSFWIAITIMIVLPLVLTVACGRFLAEKLKLDGFGYYAFMMIFYIIILGLLVAI